MVRRKRRGLVKESLSNGEASGSPAAADLRSVVPQVPLNAPVVFASETDAGKPSNGASSSAAAPPADVAAWFAALCDAPTRFEQLRAMQLLRAGVRKLSGAETGFAAFAEAAWRLFFRLFAAFSAELAPLQKHFGLFLGDLVAVSQASATAGAAWPMDAVAREELRRALAALVELTPADADEVVLVIGHLQTLLEFPFVLQTILHDSDGGAAASTLRQTIRFLADQLAVLVAPIAEYQTADADADADAAKKDGEEHDEAEETASGPTNAVLVASERCSVALKCIIVLGSLKDALERELVGETAAASSFAAASVDLARLLEQCTLILKTRVVHKDLLTQTGLGYCLLLRLLLHGSLTSGGTANDLAHQTAIEAMLAAVYRRRDVLAAAVPIDGAALRGHLEHEMRRFGDFARLAVFRGFLNSLSDDELTLPVASVMVAGDEDQSLLDFVFATVHEYCGDESLNTRLYAFQVLEAFLRRAVSIIQKRVRASVAPIAAATIASLTSAVLLNWENPSKRVNQFMSSMFAHIVHFQVLGGAFDAWKQHAVAKLIQLPHHSRARYGGLAIIVTPYGAAELLDAHAGLLQSVLHAVGIRDVSAAAAALFAQVLEELNKKGKRADASELAAWRAYWMGDLVTVLLSSDAGLRASVAMYALPLLLKTDPGCVASLIDELRAHGAATKKDVSLWAVVEVLKFARRKIAPEKLLGISMDEIQQGLENARPEARGAAFEALCASLKSTNLPTREEVQLLQRFLVISAKEITASTRMNSLNGLKTVLFRVKEFLRIHAKETANPRATEQEKQFEAAEVARARAFQQWVELFVATSVYPGALVQRSIVGLEIHLLYLQVFGVPSAGDGSLLMTPHMVTCLLNMLIGSWDVIRVLANTILDLYPAELPGFSTDSEMESLWNWALALCVSPRQRESDAGAHFMQLLYSRSVSLAAHNVAEFPTALPSGEPLADAHVRMVLRLTDIISPRLEAADLARGESPLVHGLLLSLRYIIDSTDFAPLAHEPQQRSEWKAALARVFECVHRSMQLSLAVVGDATSGVGDETLSETFEGVVGEVSAAGGKTAAIPLRVDCRGHLILDDAENAAADAATDAADTEQRAVVGSWLAARECGAIVNVIMRRVPLPTAGDDESSNLFSVALARQGGEMLLNSLFELKHKGAVAMAYEAFEGVCKSFLAHGEKNALIGGLPSAWADRLLDRLERSEQQFILRRSSGFAYSFVAILRAEPRNTAAIILPRVMTTLLRLASQDTDALAAVATAHLVWRSRVHALNILKLISQDAVLADDVAVYVSQMLEYAIFGFECRSWVVRNSSMMLFAAATQRALGDKRIADGASKNKIPSAEVFSRFPQLDGFLFHALERFTRASAAEGVAPPGLFPVLMFLSRLRPTDEDEDEQLRTRGSKPLADFVPLVRQCASQSVLAIRQMAALVLGAIVRVDKALPVLQLLSESLPQGVRAPAATAAAATSGDRTPKTANFVHGVLLQAQSLIEKCLDAPAGPAADAVLAYVAIEFLPTHLWLSSGRIKCSSVRSVMWEIVEAVVRAEAQQPGRLQLAGLLESVTKATLANVDTLVATATAPTDGNRAPGDYKCHRAVVGTFFSLLQLHWKPTAKEAAFTQTWVARVEALLQSPVLEARKRAFKQLAKFVHGGKYFDFAQEAPIVASLQAVLLKQLVVETHPTVKTRLLQLLIDFQESSSAPLAANDAAVATFLGLLSTSADVNVVGPALRLLAASVRDGAKSEAVLVTLKENVAAQSSESQPLGLRFSAAVTIERSELLLAHVAQKDGTLDIALDAWSAAVKLLQDDDSHVRNVIRRAVHAALSKIDSAFVLGESASETALLPAAVRYIVKTFTTTPRGFETVRAMLLATIDAPSVLAEYSTGAKAQDAGELSNRIFEAEGNNFYAENDLLAQLLATAVFEQDAAAPLKAEVLALLLQALTLLNESRAREQWLGGMTYYASVFPTLYSLLCVGVAALAACGDADRVAHAALLLSLQAEAQVALPHLAQSHPLIHKAVGAIGEGVVQPGVVQELVFLTPDWAAIA